MKTQAKNHQAGFTLIEYIVALVIAAIVGTMVYTYMGTMLTKSSEPIFRLKKASNLHQVMENIVADYNRLNALNLRYTWRTGIPYHIGSVVVPPTSNGYFYKCITAGTSGAGPASWPTTPAEFSDGGATWTEGGIIWKASGTPNENIVWQTGHSYSANEIMIPINNNGHYYRCTTAGTSNGLVPGVWKPSTVYAANTVVVPSLFNGRYYRSPASTTTSGTTEPTWPTTNGGTVPDGTVTWTEVPDGTTRWTEAGTILARSDTAMGGHDVLDDNIYKHLTTTLGSRYGTGYTLVTSGTNKTRFIKFIGISEDPNDTSATDEKNILKVTIKSNDTAETLTQLFTIR
jgi:prepilin-type N-terminal cleavage/methylation domain-containing protein